MTCKSDMICPLYGHKFIRLQSHEISSDRMQRHSGRRVPVCNHPEFPKLPYSIFNSPQCGGDLVAKCEIPSLIDTSMT